MMVGSSWGNRSRGDQPARRDEGDHRDGEDARTSWGPHMSEISGTLRGSRGRRPDSDQSSATRQGDDVEFEEAGAGGNGMLWLGIALAVVVVCVAVLVLERLAGAPVLERLLRLPPGHHEVAVVAGDGAEQHELLEAGLLVDHAGTGGESLLELVHPFRAGSRWH